MQRKLLAFAVAIAASTGAFAVPQDLPVYRDNGAADPTMIVGSGIPIDNFTVVTGAGSSAVALKARNRDTGQANTIVGTQYFVDAGLASVVPPAGSPQLSVDLQFSPGTSGIDPTVAFFQLDVDFDPGVGTNFATLSGPLAAGGDGFFANNTCKSGTAPVACTWNTADPFVLSQSFNLGFAFWSVLNPAAAFYDPNDPGIYDIRLSVFRGAASSTASPLATVQIQAIVGVIPEPSTLALLGLAAFGLAAFARRR